jgi:hypothetical protein
MWIRALILAGLVQGAQETQDVFLGGCGRQHSESRI